MKNINLLPTDKPSRLVIDTIENKLYLQPILHEKTINVLPQNIYITSDEKIKVGDFYITTDNKILQCDNVLMGLIYATNDYGRNSNGCKKIILTTDQSLDGVQEIDDEFLQWFVQNQSCDVVEVQKLLLCTYCGGEHCDNLACRGWEDKPYYEIIIPQEEPKQERMYSEEEVKRLAFNFYYDMSHQMGVSENLISENRINVDEWFEQNKKK